MLELDGVKGARYSKVVLISIELVEYINVLAFNNRCRRIWEIWRNHSKDRTRILTWSEKVILISFEEPHNGTLCKRRGGRKFIRNLQFVYINSSPKHLLVFPHKSPLRLFVFTHFIHFTFHPRHLLFLTNNFFATFFFLENISLVNCDFFV